MKQNSALLIVGFKRMENILNILNVARMAGVQNFVIYLDGPKDNDSELREKQTRFVELFSKLSEQNLTTTIFRSEHNYGCAVTVLRAIDFAFHAYEYLYILEDDCIPSASFFDFSDFSFGILESDHSIWLSCGTQFAPESITEGLIQISRYPLTWGWSTTRKKWIEIREALFLPPRIYLSAGTSLVEQRYWRAGRDRAIMGITDVWDTVLVYAMLTLNKRALLPPKNLVENIGDDEAATHTRKASPWIKNPANSLVFPIRVASHSDNLDKWIRKNVFGISPRHLFSTRITQILDILHMKPRKFNQGLDRRI